MAAGSFSTQQILDLSDSSSKEWIKDQVQKEVERIKVASQGNVKPLPLTVKNYSVVIDHTSRLKPKVINRIEVDTMFKFDQVKEIMVSEESPCDHNPNYLYVNVALFTSNPSLPLLIPYLFQPSFMVELPLPTSCSDQKGYRAVKSGAEKTEKKRVVNLLSEWELVNQLGQSSRLHVEQFRRL